MPTIPHWCVKIHRIPKVLPLPPSPSYHLICSAHSSFLATSPHSFMEDAELYYARRLPLPRGLPLLRMSLHGEHVELEPGTELLSKHDELKHQYPPSIHLPSDGKPRTVLMLDPDAPDRESDGSIAATYGPWLHWLVTGYGTKESNVLAEYFGPVPPKGKHRYVFLLFDEIGPVVPPASTSRKAWNAMEFLETNKANLKPIAANFFYCSAGG